MLENALEACMRMENRQEAFIGQGIRKRQNFLYVECSNSMAPGEKSEEPRRTIKKDLKNHGFGLEAMETVGDLSFIGWHTLGLCTFGIVELFYPAPYCNMANAELYHELKK